MPNKNSLESADPSANNDITNRSLYKERKSAGNIIWFKQYKTIPIASGGIQLYPHEEGNKQDGLKISRIRKSE
jgi:hypothetical protein